jgi:hypothetical protein
MVRALRAECVSSCTRCSKHRLNDKGNGQIVINTPVSLCSGVVYMAFHPCLYSFWHFAYPCRCSGPKLHNLLSANSTKLCLIFSVSVCDPPLDGLLPSFIHPSPTQKSRDPAVKKECVHGRTCFAQNWILLCKIEY